MKKHDQPTRKKKSDVVLNILMVVFLLVFVVSASVLGKKLWDAHQQKVKYDELAQIAGMQQTVPAQPEDPAQPTPEPLTKEERFTRLLEVNKNFVGWLNVPDTAINYPVVFTPDSPEYYLRRDFYGEWAMGGVLFMGEGCQLDGNSFMIHGHNMDNGTMFADLMNYQEESYYKDHPVLNYNTMDEDGRYQILGAIYYDADDPPEFPVYSYVGRLDDARFREVTDFISRRTLYQTGATAVPGDTLMMLSTCSYHTEEGRFIVAAVKYNSEV